MECNKYFEYIATRVCYSDNKERQVFFTCESIKNNLKFNFNLKSSFKALKKSISYPGKNNERKVYF